LTLWESMQIPCQLSQDGKQSSKNPSEIAEMNRETEPFQHEENQEIAVILAQCYRLAIARNQAVKCNENQSQPADGSQKSDLIENRGKIDCILTVLV
jgi:hypothetical protein